MSGVTGYAITEAMLKYGGGFVRALAQCYRLADLDNQQRIRTAWPEYWAQYTVLAMKDADTGE